MKFKTSDKSFNYNDEDRLFVNKHSLAEKKFLHRDSLLTVLFKNLHFKCLHHCFMALLLGIVLTTVVRDCIEKNEIVSGFRLISMGFGKIHIALAGWVVLFCFTCATYYCFKVWANVRSKLGPQKGKTKKYLDYSGIGLVLGYYIFAFRLSVNIVTMFELPPASASIILIEQIRFLMKIHAFIRSNIVIVLEYKEKAEKELELPTFKYFVFFLFVPTLIYKNEYPRTKTINWKVIATYAIEILAVIILYSFLMERFLIPVFKDFGIRKRTYSEVLLMVLETSLPGSLYLLATFYLVLHLTQNMFAEILRFGDRMFYKDWWTACDFTTFHRKWNVVVHDWLYTYIYKDCYEFILPGNKIFAKYVTFFISSVVHELILMHMFGFFFPVLFLIFFGVGTLLTHVKVPENSFFNTLYLLGIGYSTGMMITGYILEFYCRSNGVPPINEDLDFYIPRCITCDCYI